MEKIGVDTALAIVVIATAVVLIGGLIVIPAIQEAQAISSTGLSNRFGHQGDESSGGKRQGNGGCGGGNPGPAVSGGGCGGGNPGL